MSDKATISFLQLNIGKQSEWEMSGTISPQSNGQLTGLWEALSTEMYKSETL